MFQQFVVVLSVIKRGRFLVPLEATSHSAIIIFYYLARESATEIISHSVSFLDDALWTGKHPHNRIVEMVFPKPRFIAYRPPIFPPKS